MIFLSKSSTKVVKRGRKYGETSEIGTSEGEDQEDDDDHRESLTLSNQRFTRNYSRHAAIQAETEQASSVPPFALKTRFKQINGALSASSATTDGLHVHKEVVVRFDALEAAAYDVFPCRKQAFIWAASPEETMPEWPEPMHVFAGPELNAKLPNGAPFRAITVRDTIGESSWMCD